MPTVSTVEEDPEALSRGSAIFASHEILILKLSVLLVAPSCTTLPSTLKVIDQHAFASTDIRNITTREVKGRSGVLLRVWVARRTKRGPCLF